jgi:hypothetical protein
MTHSLRTKRREREGDKEGRKGGREDGREGGREDVLSVRNLEPGPALEAVGVVEELPLQLPDFSLVVAQHRFPALLLRQEPGPGEEGRGRGKKDGGRGGEGVGFHRCCSDVDCMGSGLFLLFCPFYPSRLHLPPSLPPSLPPPLPPLPRTM